MKIVSIGEILWDVFPNGERLGGATFNFSAHAAKLGHEVMLISAVGNDRQGREAFQRAGALGVRTDLLRTVDAATGTVEVRVDGAGQPEYRLIRPAAYDAVKLDSEDLKLAAAFAPDWIYFGTLHQIAPAARTATRVLLDAVTSARRFYDVNLRPDSYTPSLIGDLLSAAGVVKCNEEEAGVIAGLVDVPLSPLDQFCSRLARRFRLEAVCVTRGALGCAVWTQMAYAEAPAHRVEVLNTVGAGDAFAAAFLEAYQAGRTPAQVGEAANRLGALVASQSGAI